MDLDRSLGGPVSGATDLQRPKFTPRSTAGLMPIPWLWQVTYIGTHKTTVHLFLHFEWIFFGRRSKLMQMRFDVRSTILPYTGPKWGDDPDGPVQVGLRYTFSVPKGKEGKAIGEHSERYG